MFQTKYQNGYELVGLSGKTGATGRVVDVNGNIVFSGRYDDCVDWLKDRGLSVANIQNRPAPDKH